MRTADRRGNIISFLNEKAPIFKYKQQASTLSKQDLLALSVADAINNRVRLDIPKLEV
jgi:hypothetical protein